MTETQTPKPAWTDTFIGYLPINCPCCGRRRVEATLRTTADRDQFVCAITCEKCGMDEDWDHPEGKDGSSPTLINGIPEGYVKA